MVNNINLSIIIPTKNRPEILKQTLEQALIAIENTNVTVFVINDGEELKNKIEDQQIKYCSNPKTGVSSARNYGASLANSNWLLFLDDDMWISKQSVEAFKNIIKQDDSNSVYCLNWEYPKQLNKKLRNSKVGRYILNAAYNTMKGRISKNLVWNNAFEPINGIGSGSLLISKTIFNKVNGYNENIAFQGEDVDLSYKLKKNNLNIKTYTPITCYHNQQDRLDIKGYLDREYNGYVSQLNSEKVGYIHTIQNLSDKKTAFYKMLIPFEPIFLFLFTLMPNISLFDFISFRLIGILSSIQKVKAEKTIK
ncbi:MAG: glycosyltransferase family 2 protein [Chitinophagales bacterium]